MQKIKAAVVGVGALGRHHLRWLAQIDRAELVGVYDVDSEKARKYADEYGVRAFESVEAVCREAQAVSIVVPTTAHFAVASRLISSGVHCLIEKPITSSLDQARRLEALAAEHDVKVAVGHIERFNPAVLAVESMDVRPAFVEAHRLAAFDPRGTDVAVVLDLMIHDIDLVLKFVQSSVVDIQASAVAVVSSQVDIANARLTFANGAVANLTASRISLRPMRKLRFFQKSGYYSLDLAARQADVYRLATGDEPSEGFRIPLGKSDQEIVYAKYQDNGQDQLRAELESFLSAVAGERPVAVPISQANAALEIATRIEQIGLRSLERVLEGQAT